MVEKLSKALEGLKNLQFSTSLDEANTSKKEKMFFCVLAADAMVSLKTQGMQNLPVVIENMINLCDDKDSDVRMVADESLNRIIMSLSHSNMLRVQVELHNVIKKNGPARCLRAALTRFGHLSHYIRPNKGKGHVQMLIPALIEIAKREEESIHETLASSFENIFKVLGVFVQDNALKGLIKAFLHNLSSSNAVIRRCSASCIMTLVQYCRKPIIFNCYVLNSLLANISCEEEGKKYWECLKTKREDCNGTILEEEKSGEIKVGSKRVPRPVLGGRNNVVLRLEGLAKQDEIPPPSPANTWVKYCQWTRHPLSTVHVQSGAMQANKMFAKTPRPYRKNCIVPVCEDNSSDLILGVLGCLRLLLPTLVWTKNEESISGSFGMRRRQDESLLSVDRLIQVYELCLHYTTSKDHNVVAAALETLNQILENPPHLLETFFLSPAGFSRSYIQPSKESRLWSRSESEMSVAMFSVDEALLLDDSDLVSQLSAFSMGEQFQVQQSSSKPTNTAAGSADVKPIESPFKEKSFDKLGSNQTTVDIDSDTESVVSELSVSTNFLMRIETEDKDVGHEGSDISASNSQDCLYSPTDSDMVISTNAIDVGTFTDTAVPLIFCARHIAASFLLDGSPGCLKSDRTVRVSIKSLALSCISAIIGLYPVVMKMNLTKGQTESRVQGMSDVLLYCSHSDPAIRGNVNVLVGSFINSALNESKNFTSDWLSGDDSKLNIKSLIEILLKGLQDQSSVCTRRALTALKLCINRALFSVYNTQFVPFLEYLPAIAGNSYWLVKVKLVEVLSDLPYMCISDLTNSKVYQEEVVDSVLFPLLGDEDARVRSAAAEALVRIVPLLYNGKSTVLVSEYGRTFSKHISDCMKEKKGFPNDQVSSLPFSAVSSDPDESVEYSLSIIVAKLIYSLLVPETKHFLFGRLEALRLLSEKYPTTVYPKGWNFIRPGSSPSNLKSNFIAVVLSYLLTSPFGLDLGAFSSATLLLGNLFAGFSVSYLKPNGEELSNSSGDTSVKLWDVFMNESVSIIAEELLSHLLKVLNIYTRLLEEVTLGPAVESSVSGTLLPLLSPIKKQDKKSEEKAEEKKTKVVNACRQSVQYAKLQQLLKKAYTNYKVSLDKAAGDKFLDVLESTLFTLSAVLEVATVRETGRCAEEILSYLLSAVVLRPKAAVICVMQLLKSLFGTNLASNWEKKKFSSLNIRGVNLFDVFFHLPTKFLSDKIGSRGGSNLTLFTYTSTRRKNRKVGVKESDKQWLATYIRLFEPMVIKSLQLYTITGDVELQANVLHLLNQLIQLRVNYCMLDGKQIFLDFVLKQFELIEYGQIPGVEMLLPCIFKFFILLSYEKQHSKPIMSIPKILQLCDGLMASDQPVQTHCIPALAPVVEDIFFYRNSVPSSIDEKELETQREVLFSMLLRLAEFPEVMDMLASILIDSREGAGKERWNRWSRRVVDSLLPLLTQDRLRIDTTPAHNSFTHLMSSLSPYVLRPINPLLKALFVEPEDHNCPTSLQRWLSKVTILLENVLFMNEDALLNRLEETHPNVNLSSLLPTGSLMDPFNVKSFFETYNAPETVARFILKVISMVGTKICDSCSSTVQLQQKLSKFFICTYHILMSGTFHRISNSLQKVLASEPASLVRICSVFQNLIHVCPDLTCQFSYFLTLLNYCHQNYWTEILRRPLTLSAKLVQSCGIVSLCDYLCDNMSDKDTLHFLLKNCLEELVLLSHEIPVKEVFIAMQRRPDWALLLEAVSSKSFHLSPPHLVEKLLRLLEITDGSHSGTLLKLLLEKFLGSSRLALSLLAASIACRQVEHLLTLPREKAAEQIGKKDFWRVMDVFRSSNYVKRHSTLWSLLEKLGVDVFDSTTVGSSAPEVIETDHLKNIQLGEEWYFAQVKRICCQKNDVGVEVPFLLFKLSRERVSEIMSSADFNLKFLKDCLLFENPPKQEQNREGDEPKILYEPSKALLLRRVTKIWEALQEARKDVSGGNNWAEVLEKLASREGFEEEFWEIGHCLGVFMEILRRNLLAVEKEWVEGFAEFAILCLKMIEGEILREEVGIHPSHFEIGFKCCALMLANGKVGNSPSLQRNVGECLSTLTFIVSHLVPRCRLSKILREKDLATLGQSDRLNFLLYFIETTLLPEYLMASIREVVVNLCRIAGTDWGVVKVPEGCDLQDIGQLKSFISRFCLVGWSSRQQFEEIWVALLSVLGFNTQGDVPPEENLFIVQASAIAVEGITSLLKSTMLDSRTRKLIHHGRDSFQLKKFYHTPPILYWVDDYEEARNQEFLDNLEISQIDDRYVNGLVSVEYLWTALKQISSKIAVYEMHCEQLRSIGLDLPSCIYFLTELYNQWVHQASPNIKMVTSSLKSSIVMSDLFTDIAQFQWLLNFCLRVDEVIIPEDTVILPLIILGCCKAAAIVLPNEEVCEKVKKIMARSKSFPSRLAVVEGLLYLLQSYVVCYTVNHTSLPPRGSVFQADEANFAATIVDIFLPVALEVIEEFRLKKEVWTDEYERCHWSLIFYLLQHYQSSFRSLNKEFIGFIFSTLCSKSCSTSVMTLLVRGIQRLLLVTNLNTDLRDQLDRIPFEIIQNPSPAISRNGLRLLTFLSFLDKKVIGIIRLVGHGDAERVMREMERLNVLFEKLKKSYPFEVNLILVAIIYVLKGLAPSDVLSKIIQEFLFPHQPHQKIVSSLLFWVFEKARSSTSSGQSLLEDWVVFSLPNFVHGLPVSMSVFRLNCFFVNASSQPWLRSLFPVVRARVRMAEAEDKRLLCLSGAHFYRQLKQETQKKSFAQTFEKAKDIDSVFQDLLSAIS